IFGALAGLTRVESWMLVALIPFLQLIRERRISLVAILILILPPLFWFYISWKATGDALACFKQRQQYHDWLLMMNPSIARFSLQQSSSSAPPVRSTATKPNASSPISCAIISIETQTQRSFAMKDRCRFCPGLLKTDSCLQRMRRVIAKRS